MNSLDKNQNNSPNMEHSSVQTVVPTGIDHNDDASTHTNANTDNISKNVWTLKEKLHLLGIESEERSKGYGFMKRMKRRWDEEMPEKRFLSAQCLRDNAARLNKRKN